MLLTKSAIASRLRPKAASRSGGNIHSATARQNSATTNSAGKMRRVRRS